MFKLSTSRVSAPQRAKDYQAALMKRGRWLPIFQSHLRHLTPSQALVLAVLVNSTKIADAAGWVLFAPRYAEEQLPCLTAERLDRALASLERKRLIAVRMNDGRRVRVDFDALEKLT